MIEKIIPDRISLTLPTVFGEELTFLEFCGKLRAKLNECIDVVNENSSDIQQNASAISRNESDIVKLNGVVNSVSAQADENTVNINTVSGKVDKNTTDIQQNTTDIQQNTTDIQQNTTDIQQNTTAISRNESDIVKLNGVVNSISAQTDENTGYILNRKIESLFAPVILNVDSHLLGADINASVYVRIGRINPQGLGCLYAKVNLSFSGDTDAKTLKINSVQFGDRKAADITSVSTSFAAKTDVINIPIYIVGNADIPAGTSDIAVTGLNFFGASESISDISSAITLEYIPTGKDIPCESLTFTSPAGGEEDSKLIYTFKASEGCFDIFTVGAGIQGTSDRAYIRTDFSNVVSNSKIFTHFLCAGGYYNGSTISSIPDSGVPLGAAMINYTEYSEGSALYNARTTIRTINSAGGANSLKNNGKAGFVIPFGEFAHISLTFDMFN